MSGAHERHLASALACANESRYTTIKKSKKRKRLDHNPMELLTMATHALPSSALSSSDIVDADDAPVASAPATSLQLAFGNDDFSATAAGDQAILVAFLGDTAVASASVPLNRNDVIDQTIAISGTLFDRATFSFVTVSAGATMKGGVVWRSSALTPTAAMARPSS